MELCWRPIGPLKLRCCHGQVSSFLMVTISSAAISHVLLTRTSKADRLSLETEPVARENNTSWTFRVGPNEGSSTLKSLHEGTAGRRNLCHEQLTRSILRNKSQGLVPKIETSWIRGTCRRDQILVTKLSLRLACSTYNRCKRNGCSLLLRLYTRTNNWGKPADGLFSMDLQFGKNVQPIWKLYLLFQKQ